MKCAILLTSQKASISFNNWLIASGEEMSFLLLTGLESLLAYQKLSQTEARYLPTTRSHNWNWGKV